MTVAAPDIRYGGFRRSDLSVVAGGIVFAAVGVWLADSDAYRRWLGYLGMSMSAVIVLTTVWSWLLGPRLFITSDGVQLTLLRRHEDVSWLRIVNAYVDGDGYLHMHVRTMEGNTSWRVVTRGSAGWPVYSIRDEILARAEEQGARLDRSSEPPGHGVKRVSVSSRG